MARNANLYKAMAKKNDEFYTSLTDVEAELAHYVEHFRGKAVYCNCDDPGMSAFWKYFYQNFDKLGLEKLTATYYVRTGQACKTEYDGRDVAVTSLVGNGDFRSRECLDLLDECDVVVTNPPFSLFREYVRTLMEHDKKFLIIGSMNAIPYKEFFPLLMCNRVWAGYNNGAKMFYAPDGFERKLGNTWWYTNLGIGKLHERLALCKKYVPRDYPEYDNYDVINVGRVADIPCDYDGVMGVPITFMDKYCPEQFEIVGIACGNSWANYPDTLKSLNFDPNVNKGDGIGVLNGKGVYARILIRKKSTPRRVV